MSNPLPTLNDMLDPNKKQAPQPKDEKEKEKKEKETDKNKNVKKPVVPQPKAKEQSVKKEKGKKEEEEEEEDEEEEEEEDDEEETKPKKVEPKKAEPKKVESKKPEDKKEPKKVEPKKEEPKKEEPKKEEPKKEEPKKEEPKKEEPKKEEPKKEEPKKEEPKKEEAKKEDEPKVEEEKKPEKKIPKKPREPEKKEPTDFTELKKELNDIKAAGNELFKNKSYEEAIEKYKEGYEKINNSLSDIISEKSFNPQSPELFTLSLQIMSNLSLCYTKTEKIDESIDLDLKINSLDKNYDKAYIRLYSNYLKQGKIAQAVYYGDGLLNFDDETKKKYENEVNQINQTKKDYQAQLDAQRAKERKEMIKNIAKYAIPVIILIAAFGVYFFFYKRKRITK